MHGSAGGTFLATSEHEGANEVRNRMPMMWRLCILRTSHVRRIKESSMLRSGTLFWGKESHPTTSAREILTSKANTRLMHVWRKLRGARGTSEPTLKKRRFV